MLEEKGKNDRPRGPGREPEDSQSDLGVEGGGGGGGGERTGGVGTGRSTASG